MARLQAGVQDTLFMMNPWCVFVVVCFHPFHPISTYSHKDSLSDTNKHTQLHLWLEAFHLHPLMTHVAVHFMQKSSHVKTLIYFLMIISSSCHADDLMQEHNGAPRTCTHDHYVTSPFIPIR